MLKNFKSHLYLDEMVDNKERKFGSVNQYYPVIVIDSEGKLQPALFTENEINVAIERAQSNPEDVEKEEKKSFWEIIFGL